MKNKIAILRLGTDIPISGDSLMLEGLISSGNMIGGPIEGGIITLIYTDASKEDIITRAKDAEIALDDCLPVFVWDIEKDENIFTNIGSIPFIQGMIKEFNKMIGRTERVTINMTIDDVLDKINQNGLDSLSEVELSLLKDLK
tara:strand:- start:95 stop:523 length:429 start_codon:yes stop_codon:yes gene_type:complete